MDIVVRDDARDWIVIGWFTPDYRPLADKFAKNLCDYGIPHHLFAKEKLAKGWDTKQKASVVLEAMSAYPNKTIVLMDVDCLVTGDISPVTQIGLADVGISVKVRCPRMSRANRLTFTVGSRVAVFAPTDAARAFAEEWKHQCELTNSKEDEAAMAWAYALRPEISYRQLDQRFAGHEIGVPSRVMGIVVWHDAAHGKLKLTSAKGLLKAIERRFFRTGGTKEAMVR